MEGSKNAHIWGYLQPLLHNAGTNQYSLPLPGSYGREALIRPHLDCCPCRKRNTPNRPRCDNCKSVCSLATFIPRKDLLHFSRDKDENMVLEISGNNSMQIVHVHRKSTVSRSDKDLSISDFINVHDGDEISLHCQGLGVASSDVSTTRSLVRFRVVKIEPNTKDTTYSIHDGVGECDIYTDNSEQGRTCSKSDALNVDQTPCATIKNRSEIPAVEAICKESPYEDKDELKNSNQSNQANGGIALPTFAANAKTYDSQSEAESPTQLESAPLTMPMHFLEATSDSFDNNQHSQSHTDNGIKSSQTTPQRGNTSSKRKHVNINNEATITGFEKVSTIERSQVSVPISSLTYERLRQLHEESSDINIVQHRSVRNAVLSLTLALTSDASAWDSSFINACNEKESTKEELGSGKSSKWMPRLLQGTDIILCKEKIN